MFEIEARRYAREIERQRLARREPHRARLEEEIKALQRTHGRTLGVKTLLKALLIGVGLFFLLTFVAFLLSTGLSA